MKMPTIYNRIGLLLVSVLCTLTVQAQLRAEKEAELLHNGQTVEKFCLSNGTGMTIRVTNFAASLTDVVVPDRQGRPGHVVLGLDSLALYMQRQPKLGATVGRYAGRIGGASFQLDGVTYPLEKSTRGNYAIHGGTHGFHTRIFRTDTVYCTADTAFAAFSLRSAHGDGGFPGNLDVRVVYKLTRQDEVVIDYTAVTDRPTVVNFTNHSYFNLSGAAEPILHHSYQLAADSVCELDASGIPTGRMLPVASTAFDLRTSRSVEADVREGGVQYDTYYKLNDTSASLRLAAVVRHPESGRVLRAYTTEPGVQFYIPRSDLGYLHGHDGARYGTYYGFCLEMQHCPDSPRHPHFPSTVLRPGEVYRQTTVYQFSVE